MKREACVEAFADVFVGTEPTHGDADDFASELPHQFEPAAVGQFDVAQQQVQWLANQAAGLSKAIGSRDVVTL